MSKKERRATVEERIRAVELMEDGSLLSLWGRFLVWVGRRCFDWQKKMYREGGLAALSTKFASGPSHGVVGSADDAFACNDRGT